MLFDHDLFSGESDEDGAAPNPNYWPKSYTIFELKYLKVMFDCKKTTRIISHYHL